MPLIIALSFNTSHTKKKKKKKRKRKKDKNRKMDSLDQVLDENGTRGL